jgi:hypothetical protein
MRAACLALVASQAFFGKQKCHAIPETKGLCLRSSLEVHDKIALDVTQKLSQKEARCEQLRRALNLFMFMVLAHWAEHLTQAYQLQRLAQAVVDGEVDFSASSEVVIELLTKVRGIERLHALSRLP